MAKFFGDINQLKSATVGFGLNGVWSEIDKAQKFTANDGGILLWYNNTKTLQCQGKGESKIKIEKFILDIDGNISQVPIATNNLHKEHNLFVVYGHDESSRDQLELILSKLGIEPFILAKTSGNGLTIIEALESQVGQDGNASAGIVLLTPDDMGYAIREGETSIKNRARQNVILEMGMLIAKLGRQNTIILIKGKVERPSDTDGIIYHAYKTHVKEVVTQLAERLETIGFAIDHKKALEATR